MAQQIQ
jgi:hypothetical protein